MSTLSTTQPSGQRFTIDTTNAGPLDVLLEPEGSGGAVPPPIAGVDDGATVVAGSGGAAGLLTYVKGTLGQVLQWNGVRSLFADLFYQLIEDSDGTPLPQQPTTHYNAELVVTNDGAINATRIRAPGIAVAQATALAAQQPFRATYFVDPAFAGTQLGSQSNPFTTIAAAFAAAVALALAGATVFIPPAVAVTENVVFPDNGGCWEIACQQGVTLSSGSKVARINGTVTVNSTNAALTIFALTNLFINGNISGNSGAGGVDIYLVDCRHTGTCTLTQSGAGVWAVVLKGTAAVTPNKLGGSTTGLISLTGNIFALNWVLESGFTINPSTNAGFHQIRGCQLGTFGGGPVSFTFNDTTILRADFYDCWIPVASTFTAAAANYVLNMDGATLAWAQRAGITLTGTNLQLKTLNANAAPIPSNITGNVGSTVYGGRDPAGLYEVDFEMTLLAAGTLGLAQLNVIYTDVTGTLITAPVGTPLDITGLVGSKQQGALRFQHNGAAAPIAFSVTGVTTAGAMSVALATSIQRRN